MIVCLTRAHSRSSLGSNTTHCVPSSIDSSRNRKSRRTLTYFQSVFVGAGARAPDADAAAGKRADAVHAARIEDVLLALGDLELERRARRRTTSFAGALNTPRSMSVLA